MHDHAAWYAFYAWHLAVPRLTFHESRASMFVAGRNHRWRVPDVYFSPAWPEDFVVGLCWLGISLRVVGFIHRSAVAAAKPPWGTCLAGSPAAESTALQCCTLTFRGTDVKYRSLTHCQS